MFFKIGNSLVNLMEAFLMKQQEQLPEHWKEGKVRDTECQLLSQQRGSWLEEGEFCISKDRGLNVLRGEGN